MSENTPTKIDYSNAEVVRTLKQTVAIGATDAEFVMFAEQCKATGLNPFKRELWFIKANGRVQIMTGIQGFFAIANSDPNFDGHESGLVNSQGELVSGAYPKNDFIGAWARVYRKDRKIPTEGIAMLSEYDKGHGNWKTMRRVMILKCAESIALRKAFPQQLNGLYTQEEMPTDFSERPAPATDLVTADDLPKPPQGDYSEVAIEYTLDPKSNRYNFHEWKNRLKKNGFKWDPERKVWVGSQRFEELESAIVGSAQQSVPFAEDDLPEWELESNI